MQVASYYKINDYTNSYHVIVTNEIKTANRSAVRCLSLMTTPATTPAVMMPLLLIIVYCSNFKEHEVLQNNKGAVRLVLSDHVWALKKWPLDAGGLCSRSKYIAKFK